MKRPFLYFTWFLTTISFWSAAQPPVYIWAKTLPGNVETIQRTILTDVSGNVYISGVFFGTVDFDPGPGVANITPSPYGCNIYIAKYDANGNYLWAKNIPIAASYGGSSMILDGSGNIFITGFYTGSATDFDPAAGVVCLPAAGGNDIYLAKYDNNGNYLWAKSIGSTGDDRGNEILADASGNILLTGVFSNTVDFDPGAGTANLTAVGGYDIFLAKYNSSGAFQWVKQIGGTTTEDTRDLALDLSGNIFLTGLFSGTTDFDPSAATANLLSAGGNDIFIAKYDASGNYLWANRFGGTNSDIGSALKIDATGNVVVSGVFMGTVDFDPGPSTTNLVASSSATFYGKYDTNGNYLWIKQLPINFANSDIALTPTGNIFIAGYYGNGYGSPIDMDPGTGIANLAVPTNLPPPTWNILGYYDGLGNYLWAGVFGRQCYCSVMGYKSSIHVDASGYVYYAGIFNGPWGSGTVDFDPGTGVANLTAPSSVDNAFFAKYQVAANPLPVELLYFRGENKNNVNYLSWITTAEINNDFYDVERSANGIDFMKLGSVKGHGTSSQHHEYKYEDHQPLTGINYYRLNQIDFDGEQHHSGIIAVTNETSNDNCFVYTQNSKGIFSLHCPGINYRILYIFDVQGRLIKEISADSSSGDIKIDLTDYSGSMFMLRFSDGKQYRNMKLLTIQ